MVIILMVLMGTAMGALLLKGVEHGVEKRKAKKVPAFEPYVVGVNKFLIGYREWRTLLNIELDKMKTQYDNIEYPEDWVLLEPLKDPNPPTKVFSYADNMQRLVDNQRHYSRSMYPSQTYNEARSAASRYPSRYGSDHYGIGYTKECEKCLQPTLTDAKSRYCTVCTNNMAEVKKINQLHDEWVIDTSYKPAKSAGTMTVGDKVEGMEMTFVRYINKRTGEYKMEALSTGNARLKELSAKSRSELRATAMEYDFEVNSSMSKGDFISMIRSAESEWGDQRTGIEVGSAAIFVGTMTKEELFQMTKVKLFEFADKHNIPVKSKMLKAELVDAIHDALNAPVEEESDFERVKKRLEAKIAQSAQVPDPMTKEQATSYGDYFYESLMGKHHHTVPYVPTHKETEESMWTGVFDFPDL